MAKANAIEGTPSNASLYHTIGFKFGGIMLNLLNRMHSLETDIDF